MIYCDDYGIVDLNYIVQACMVDPGTGHPGEKPEYLISFILHVGHQGQQCFLSYPQRSLRDIAFEQIVAMIKQQAAEMEEEGEH